MAYLVKLSNVPFDPMKPLGSNAFDVSDSPLIGGMEKIAEEWNAGFLAS